jgi:F-type H+-transporting ATPase subunit delta
MNESQISVRYARALFQSASEKQILDMVNKDMELLSGICALENFRYLLMLPSLQPSRKSKLVETVLKAHATDISLAMINLVIQNKREVYLPAIARNFRELYRRARGIRTASLVTAQSVDDAAIEKVRKLITRAYDSGIELSSSIDQDLIGGFILTIEDMQYDASVATSLKKMKKQLLQTSIEKK